MKDFIKKAGLAFWLSIAAGMFAVIGAIIMIVTNMTAGYVIINGTMGIAMALIAVALIAAGCYATYKLGAENYITAAVRLVALVLLMVAFGVLLGDRVGLAADLLTWDSHNALGWSVFYTSVAAMVFILLSALVLVVCAFFKGNKSEKN